MKPSNQPNQADKNQGQTSGPENQTAQNIATLRNQFANASLAILAGESKKRATEKLKKKNALLIEKAFRQHQQLLIKRGNVIRKIKEFRPDGTIVIEDSEKGTRIMNAEQLENALSLKLLQDPYYYELMLAEEEPEPEAIPVSSLKKGDTISYEVERKDKRIKHKLQVINVTGRGQLLAKHISGGSGSSRIILISNFALVTGEPIYCQQVKKDTGEVLPNKLRLEAPLSFQLEQQRRAA